MNIESIQTPYSVPVVLQSMGPKAVAKSVSGGDLNAFLFLLNGILKAGDARLPQLKALQPGTPIGASPFVREKPDEKGHAEDDGTADREQLPPTLSHMPLESGIPVFESPLFVVPQLLITEHGVHAALDAPPVGEERLTLNVFADDIRYVMEKGNARAARRLITTPSVSAADLAFALRLSSETASVPKPTTAAPDHETASPVETKIISVSSIESNAFVGDPRHRTKEELSVKSPSIPLLQIDPVADHFDSSRLEPQYIELRQDDSKNGNIPPSKATVAQAEAPSPLKAVRDADSASPPSGHRFKPELIVNWPSKPAVSGNVSQDELLPSSRRTPNIPVADVSRPNGLTESILDQPSESESVRVQGSPQAIPPAARRASDVNLGEKSKTYAQREESPRRAINRDVQLRNTVPKRSQDSPDTTPETRSLSPVPAKSNFKPIELANAFHENKPEMSTIMPGVSTDHSAREISSPLGRTNLRPVFDLPPVNETKGSFSSQSARQISFKLGRDVGAVNVVFTEKAGKVDVTVRTPDQSLTRSLQADVGDLVTRLEGHGLRTETWMPVAAHHAPASIREPANLSNGHEQPSNSSSWSGNQQQRREHNESNPRQQPRWASQLDESLSPEDKLNAAD